MHARHLQSQIPAFCSHVWKLARGKLRGVGSARSAQHLVRFGEQHRLRPGAVGVWSTSCLAAVSAALVCMKSAFERHHDAHFLHHTPRCATDYNADIIGLFEARRRRRQTETQNADVWAVLRSHRRCQEFKSLIAHYAPRAAKQRDRDGVGVPRSSDGHSWQDRCAGRRLVSLWLAL